MAQRLYTVSGRIVISKPGYEASPALPDAFKLFDSNWGATGMIAFQQSFVKSAGSPLFVPFPFPLHYPPAVEGPPGTVFNDGIIFDANVVSGTYRAWAISQ